MLKVGAKIITLRAILGIPLETEMKIKRVLPKEEVFDAEDGKGNVFRMFMSTKGTSWKLVNEFEWLENLDGSDLAYLNEDDLHQMLHAALDADDRNWFEEIRNELKELSNYKLEELQDGYKQCGIEW